MTRKISLVSLFAVAVCVLTLTGCGMQNDTTVTTTDNGTVTVTTWSTSGDDLWDTTVIVATWSDDSDSMMTGSNTGMIMTWEQMTWSTGGNTAWTTTADANAKTFTSKTTSYKVPSNQEASITVIAKVDTKTQVIKEITIQNVSNDPNTAKYQKSFNDKIWSTVVGKTLADAHVSKLNGSSLTSVAFNNAIDDIKSQM